MPKSMVDFSFAIHVSFSDQVSQQSNSCYHFFNPTPRCLPNCMEFSTIVWALHSDYENLNFCLLTSLFFWSKLDLLFALYTVVLLRQSVTYMQRVACFCLLQVILGTAKQNILRDTDFVGGSAKIPEGGMGGGWAKLGGVPPHPPAACMVSKKLAS